MGQSERLASAMKEVGIGSAAELARRAKIGEVSVRAYVSGDRNPPLDKCEAMARVLGVRGRWLFDGTGPRLATVPVTSEVRVPLISWVQAGDLATVETISEGQEGDQVVTTNLPPGGKWVALRVEGNSMDLVAPDGSRIFVNRDETDLVSGRYYVVCFDDGKATFKRFRENPKRFEPESTDRSHETIFPDDHARVTVIGRVRKIVHDLD